MPPLRMQMAHSCCRLPRGRRGLKYLIFRELRGLVQIVASREGGVD